MITAVFERPSERMSFLVNRYLFLKADADNEPYTDKFIPDGYAGVVFNFSGNIKIVEKEQVYSLPPFFFTVPMSHSLLINVEPPADSMIAICRAPALSRVFGLAMNSLHPLSTHFLEAESHLKLLMPVIRANSDSHRIQAFEEAVWSLVRADGYIDDQIDRIYDDILTSVGKTKVEKIAHDYAINIRSLRRKFSQRVGVSPKELMSIVRVHRLWSYVMENPGLDNFDFVYLGGFYDQAHFIHDFKKIVGETPGAFFKRNSDNARALSGKES